jgi:5S rRNA maturation endonuclease (ribonuclease M5)
MSRERYEIYKKLEDLASEMNYSVDGVIVEGVHDKKTLRLLGYSGPILTCSKLSLFELTDYAAKRFANMAVLTDFDKAGETLGKNLSTLLVNRKVKVRDFYRRRFRILFKKARISTVESVYRLKRQLFKRR